MQVQKFRGAADANGLVPAGTFLAQLSAKLEEANYNEALRQAELDQGDRALEATYRELSASRIYRTPHDRHVVM